MSEEHDEKLKELEVQKLEVEIEQMQTSIAKSKADADNLTAQSAKLEAEIKSLELANVKAECDASKAGFEAHTASVELDERQHEWNLSQERHQREKAVDEENFLYRFGSEVSSSSVSGCVKKLTQWHRTKKDADIEIIFSSPGGSIIDGFELFDFIQHLRNQGHHITTGTLGMAASMAGILLQAGDTRWIGQQAWLMIHRAAFGAYGKTCDVEDELLFVKRIEERIIDIFTARSNLTKQKIKRNWDRKDWWISAEQAVDLGLVDEVRAMMPEMQTKKDKK